MGVFRGIVRVRNWECRHGEEEEDETDTAAVQDSSRVTMSSAGGLDSRPLPSTEKIVDVSGTFVGHTTELVLCQGLEPVQSLFFGSLFAGETRTIETLLRNNGPQPLTFKTSISFGGGAAGGGAATGVEEDREAAKTSEEIQRMERKQGGAVLDGGQDAEYAGSKQQLRLVQFALSGSSSTSDPLCVHHMRRSTGAQVDFRRLSKDVHPSAPVVPDVPPLDFGDVHFYDRADLLLSLKNLSGLLVRFEVGKGVAHYSVSPRTGRLDVLQSQSVMVSFAPTQLGTFNSFLTLHMNDGVLKIPVKVLGRAAVVGPAPPVSERLVGGFDLVFCSTREQFFQQAITFALNGVHPRQVTIVAKVAPIVVELAPEELCFDFGALDLGTSVARDVVITNTCDLEAPFVWKRLSLLATPDGSSRPDSSKSNATTTVTATTMAEKGANASGSV
ncbi:hypothetical protein PF002_g17079 [Phytophthora fragariae]|uniref:Abnormal spindle-like microcephaly-associated protein ASH domain-containing protein n=1 Tax=Phytophthora fragariae TaxID=53985 RepID=A0A6A3YDG6_9STRA|nr:hypothetical protein PF002_g17079 [Phytophthora fragariae]